MGQWSHLAVVFDGTRATFYVNGNVVSSPQISAGTLSITPRDSLLHMAADARPSQHFRGTLDDVRVYNRAESQLEVQTDMNTQLAAPASDPTAPSVTITAPANDAIVSGNRTITADASDDVGVAGVQFYVDATPLGPEDTTAPYAANWDTRVMANGAHTLTARARDTDGKTKLSPLINVTVANSDHFQNQVLATGFELPTAIEFLPDGRMLVAELAGRIKVLPPPYTTPDPALFLQMTNVGSDGVQQGIYRRGARSRLRQQPLLLRLLYAGYAELAIVFPASPPTPLSPAPFPAASSSSTRIPGRACTSTTAAR